MVAILGFFFLDAEETQCFLFVFLLCVFIRKKTHHNTFHRAISMVNRTLALPSASYILNAASRLSFLIRLSVFFLANIHCYI